MSEVYDRALKVAVDALAVEVFEDVPPADALSEGILSDATAIVKALAAAGLLLPEGAERRTLFSIHWEFAKARPLDWGVDNIEHAKRVLAGPPIGAVSHEVRQREQWTTPWSVVEPVAIQGADSVD